MGIGFIFLKGLIFVRGWGNFDFDFWLKLFSSKAERSREKFLILGLVLFDKV